MAACLLNPLRTQAGGSVQFLEPYSVEGLAVGTPVNRASRAYKRYKCKISDQYEESIACKVSRKANGATNIITILHLESDIVTYINKAVFPAIFTVEDINSELQRLSKRFHESAQILKSDEGIIAKWGDIDLIPLGRNELNDLAQDRNPKLGFLVDFRMNFHESAKNRLPVYRLTGGKGFLWIARFQTKDREGTLRFLAADPSQMHHVGGSAPTNVPSSYPTTTEPPNRPSLPSDKTPLDPACEKYPDLC